MSELGEVQILLIDDRGAMQSYSSMRWSRLGRASSCTGWRRSRRGPGVLEARGPFCWRGPCATGGQRPEHAWNGRLRVPEPTCEKIRALGAHSDRDFEQFAIPTDVLRCYQLGANSYITKPMSLQTFVETIGTLVRYWLDIAKLPDPRMVD